MEQSNAPQAVSSFVERIATPPAAIYYTLLFTSPEQHESLGAAFAFRHEVRRSVDTTISPEVAGTRLAWWGEEVARVARAEPRHPLTRHLLSDLADDPERLASLLAEIVGAAQAACLEPPPTVLPTLEHQLAHDWGATCRLIARLLAPTERRAEPWIDGWANPLGIARGLLESEVRAREQTALRLAEAVGALPGDARALQRPLLVLASLTAAGNRLSREPVDNPTGEPAETAASGRPRAERATTLAAAIGTLWHAWRAAGRAERGRLPSNLQNATDVTRHD
jgi:hypothetical protein